MTALQALDIRLPAELVHNGGWFLAFGIGLVVLGVAAVARAVAATVVSMLFFGWLLLLAAGIEVAQVVMVGKWAGMFQHLMGAVLFGVVGSSLQQSSRCPNGVGTCSTALSRWCWAFWCWRNGRFQACG
jgi:uncharacterized membrane protein HdeD (DUF308 family)